MLKRRSVLASGRSSRATPLELQAKLFRGLGDPVRLSIVNALTEAPRTAGELARSLGVTPSNASNHLRCLLECGLVAISTDGRFNRYRLAMPSIPQLLDAAAQVLTVAAPAIEECLEYGPPSRLALRPRSLADHERVRTERHDVSARELARSATAPEMN